MDEAFRSSSETIAQNLAGGPRFAYNVASITSFFPALTFGIGLSLVASLNARVTSSPWPTASDAMLATGAPRQAATVA